MALALLVSSCASPDKMRWPYPTVPAEHQNAGVEAPGTRPPITPRIARTPKAAAQKVVPAPATIMDGVALGGPLANETQPVTVVQKLSFAGSREVSPYLILAWPLPATGINSLYGPRRDPVDNTTRHHNGVDLDAGYGVVVVAAADAYVSSAGWQAGHGRRITLEHAGGFQTGYSHLSQILVTEGIWVRAGQAIGRVGNSGRSTGPHLHFEVSRWGTYLDPLDYLGVRVALD